MGNNYSRGRSFEYRTQKHLEEQGWTVFRSAGSHSVADLIALRAGECMLVQCKTDGAFSKSQRTALLAVGQELGVQVVLAKKDKAGHIVMEVIE